MLDNPIALDVLRRLGYVHRDVSPGNILRFDDRGILTDLEYIKHENETLTHDVRLVSGSAIKSSHRPTAAQGTRLFMSSEVDARSYLHTLKLMEGDVVFRNNCLHDLESVWWTWLWFMLAHTCDDALAKEDFQGNQSPYDPTSQHSAFIATFNGDGLHRLQLFRSKEIRQHLATLPLQMSSSWKAAIQWQLLLLNRYIDAESGLALGEALQERVFEDAHDEARRWIQQAAQDTNLGTIIRLTSSKRAQEEAAQPANKRQKA